MNAFPAPPVAAGIVSLPPRPQNTVPYALRRKVRPTNLQNGYTRAGWVFSARAGDIIGAGFCHCRR